MFSLNSVEVIESWSEVQMIWFHQLRCSMVIFSNILKCHAHCSTIQVLMTAIKYIPQVLSCLTFPLCSFKYADLGWISICEHFSQTFLDALYHVHDFLKRLLQVSGIHLSLSPSLKICYYFMPQITYLYLVGIMVDPENWFKWFRCRIYEMLFFFMLEGVFSLISVLGFVYFIPIWYLCLVLLHCFHWWVCFLWFQLWSVLGWLLPIPSWLFSSFHILIAI